MDIYATNWNVPLPLFHSSYNWHNYNLHNHLLLLLCTLMICDSFDSNHNMFHFRNRFRNDRILDIWYIFLRRIDPPICVRLLRHIFYLLETLTFFSHPHSLWQQLDNNFSCYPPSPYFSVFCFFFVTKNIFLIWDTLQSNIDILSMITISKLGD